MEQRLIRSSTPTNEVQPEESGSGQDRQRLQEASTLLGAGRAAIDRVLSSNSEKTLGRLTQRSAQ